MNKDLHIYINNEEVVCDKNITITEEMLSTSSTILKNCFPKAWEGTKDYVSNFYFPKDYSKCKIIRSDDKPFTIDGETTQEQNPTPDDPKPIISKTGTITEKIHGKDYTFNLGNIELNKLGNTYDYIAKSTGKNLFDKDNANILDAYFNTNTPTITSDAEEKIIYIPCEPNKAYTFSKIASNRFIVGYTTELPAPGVQVYMVTTTTNNNPITLHLGSSARYLVMFYWISTDTLTSEEILDTIQIEQGTQATDPEPYGEGKWYVCKKTNKLTIDGTENYTFEVTPNFSNTGKTRFTIYNVPTDYNYNYPYIVSYYNIAICSPSTAYTNYDNAILMRYVATQQTRYDMMSSTLNVSTVEDFKTWLGETNLISYYVKERSTYEVITESTLLSQLNNVGMELIFCGVVKNTGNISLNPRDPHYVDLQVLDFKTLLSEGETLNYVITGKTITEAIEQVVSSISEYGFVVGNINILSPDDIINAYSTLNKTAYDVFQYIADITQSKWFTRVIDENTVAIDFYDPTLMPQATKIEYTKEYFEDNDIEDMTFNYSTNDYRNKQIMTSDEVYANITQTETLVSNGYQDSYMCQNKIGTITSITVNGVSKTFATKSEVELGASADFEYQPGEMTFTSNTTYSAGAIIIITYYPIVRGREIVLNNEETSRIQSQINRKGTISRYENRNDTTSSQELIKIGQSYIKYKGKAEITLKIISSKNLFNIGQIVEFDAPLEDLSNEYMVKSKTIEIITTIDQIFYTYELSSNFNSENAINYFDNQRAKSQGNIGEGETIARAIDIESTALIKFYDTEINEVEVSNPTSLDFALDGVLI